ncbi:MAG: pitrilysin family protein [Chitinophagales bacterium]
MQNRLNRNTAPPLRPLQALKVIQPQKLHLDNDIPVYLWNMGTQEVVMIRLIFQAGRWHEKQRLSAEFTARMLREGTQQMNAKQLHNRIEYHGATLKSSANKDYASITLYTLTKHLPYLLPVLQEMLTEASFPEKELQTILQNSKQKLLVNLEENDYLAQRHINRILFGDAHPYGYNVQTSDYDAVNTEILKAFYQQCYAPNNCQIYIAGKLSEEELGLVNRYLGTSHWQKRVIEAEPNHLIPTYKPQQEYISKKDSVQAAICMGQPLFNKTHPDYLPFYVLNTLFGGFFGSRLMANIREEKGLTYGIYSTDISFLRAGYWNISTEVADDAWEETIKEIFFEMNRLKDTLVEPEELELVKSYLMGNLLSSVDGAFNLASALEGIYLYGLEIDYFDKIISSIEEITPNDLQKLACKYFDEQQLSYVVVGK